MHKKSSSEIAIGVIAVLAIILAVAIRKDGLSEKDIVSQNPVSDIAAKGDSENIPPVIPQTDYSEHRRISLHDLNSLRDSVGKFLIEGYVIKKEECGPCPEGASCALCPPDFIVVSENTKDIYRKDNKSQVVLLTGNVKLSTLLPDKKYIFLAKEAENDLERGELENLHGLTGIKNAFLLVSLEEAKDFGNDGVANISLTKPLSEEIKKKCTAKSCDPKCLDGWGESCFFDTSKNNEKDIVSGFRIKAKNVCFGYHFESVCGDCEDTYEINQVDTSTRMSCEEFYHKIEEKNKSCGNCLKEIVSSA